jgi:hypothetical protein
MQLQAHNALASLWCERSENETALSHLQSADTLYNHITQLQGSSAAGPAQQSTTQQQPADAASASSDATSSSSSNWQAGLVDSDQVERDRTTTLFYMAQVYGLMGDRMQSASYCAATLNRQLKQGESVMRPVWRTAHGSSCRCLQWLWTAASAQLCLDLHTCVTHSHSLFANSELGSLDLTMLVCWLCVCLASVQVTWT